MEENVLWGDLVTRLFPEAGMIHGVDIGMSCIDANRRGAGERLHDGNTMRRFRVLGFPVRELVEKPDKTMAFQVWLETTIAI